MGCCCSKPVDEPLAKTPSKRESRQETRQEARQETQQETQPKGKIQTPSMRERARGTAILLLDFTSIFADVSEILKPVKVVSECIKKILEVTRVSFNLPDETSLFMISQSACRR